MSTPAYAPKINRLKINLCILRESPTITAKLIVAIIQFLIKIVNRNLMALIIGNIFNYFLEKGTKSTVNHQYRLNIMTMKPLEYNLKIFQMMAVFPVPDGTGSHIKYRNYCFGIFIFLSAVLTAISSITSVVVYLTSDLEKTLYAMFQVGAMVYVSYSYVVFHIIWKRLRNIFPRLQKISDESM